jgi:hypothetical protein
MKVVRVVKSQGVILCTGVLNILVFSSMVGYLDGIFTVTEKCILFFEDGKMF